MQRIIYVLIGIVFLATCVQAQNNAVITSTGNDNDAEIIQTGNGDFATTTQDGNNNDAGIDQITSSSTAEQIQTGNSNEATIEQLNHYVPASPTVNENAYQEQVGNGNEAELWQWSGAGTGNNDGNQYQEGNANIVRLKQRTTNSIADQDQIGNNNWARAYQHYDDNYVMQLQVGNNNKAAIDEQSGQSNYAEQEQHGNNNKMFMRQYGYAWISAGARNTAYQYQDGNDNWAGDVAHIDQGYGIYQGGEDHWAEQSQIGNNNKAKAWQKGYFNTLYQYQDGDRNWAGEWDGVVSTPGIRQLGNDNWAEQDQIGNDNWVKLEQNGDDNESYQTQNDDWNKSDVYQEGDLNISTVIQNGANGGTAEVNVSSVSLIGNSNNALIIQTYGP